MKIVSKKSILRLFSFVVVLFALAPQAVAMPDSVYVCLVNGEVENHSVAAIDSIAFQIFNAIPEKDDSLNVCHKDGKTTSYTLYMVDSLAFKKPAAQQSAQWVAVTNSLSVCRKDVKNVKRICARSNSRTSSTLWAWAKSSAVNARRSFSSATRRAWLMITPTGT